MNSARLMQVWHPSLYVILDLYVEWPECNIRWVAGGYIVRRRLLISEFTLQYEGRYIIIIHVDNQKHMVVKTSFTSTGYGPDIMINPTVQPSLSISFFFPRSGFWNLWRNLLLFSSEIECYGVGANGRHTGDWRSTGKPPVLFGTVNAILTPKQLDKWSMWTMCQVSLPGIILVSVMRGDQWWKIWNTWRTRHDNLYDVCKVQIACIMQYREVSKVWSIIHERNFVINSFRKVTVDLALDRLKYTVHQCSSM